MNRQAGLTSLTMLGSGLAAYAIGRDPLAAAEAAKNETLNNWLHPREQTLKQQAGKACQAGQETGCQIQRMLHRLDAERENTPSAKFAQGFVNAMALAGGSALLMPVEILQAVAEGRSLDALANVLKGIAGLPSHLVTGLTSSDPATQGAAVADSLMLVDGAAALAKSVVRRAPPADTLSIAARVDNNSYRDGSIADAGKTLSATGNWKPAWEVTAQEANALIAERLPTGAVVKQRVSADALNADVVADNVTHKPHYVPNTETVTFTTTQADRYVRVYVSGPGSVQTGAWLMRAADIEGLSAAQIASKYALPQIPGIMEQPPQSASPRGDHPPATIFFAVARCETVGSYADAHKRHP